MIFPSRCVICSMPVSIADNCLCPECFGRIGLVHEGCPVCSGILEGQTCSVCSDRAFYPEWNVAVSEYEGVVEEILHQYKFKKRNRLHEHLGRLACAEIRKKSVDIDLVTAVPMSREKRWKRGFNQSELIARALARGLDKPYRRVMRERIRSLTQRNLRFRDRFVNVLGRYRITRVEAVRGKRILLVDDIFTTGATINECSRMLIQSGAAGIFSVTIARAGKKT